VSNEAAVTVVAGSYLTAEEDRVRLPHVWTPGGVGVATDFTSAHLLHLAVAGCVPDVEQRQLRVEQVAEIPKALRLGCPVVRRVP
jgi:hypothetical protein